MIRAATSLELRKRALIHDDVMDDSDTRRGALRSPQPRDDASRSALARFLAGLRNRQCNPARRPVPCHGQINLLFESGIDPASLIATKPLFDLMRTELAAGQYLDVVEQARADINVDRAPSSPATNRRSTPSNVPPDRCPTRRC